MYLISLLFFRKSEHGRRLKRAGVFVGLYLFTTLLLVPNIAPIFGREKVSNSELVKPHSMLYVLANRNYVRPELNVALGSIASSLNKRSKGIHVVYLDANFPFIDGFPLLPHLSHNDGKKLDLTFIYQDDNGSPTNLKRSRSGYGVYEEPRGDEFDQTNACNEAGYWQYGFPEHLTLGEVNKGIELDKDLTTFLAQAIVHEASVGKLFIEPHLKNRLGVENSKVRFHGCQAVRHDDHIHFQLK